jgi:transcriptional regulator with XRE-family HTH domain
MATGKQIKHYREKLKWTLQQLSDASDVDVGTISALENRDSSRSKFFSPLAKAIGLTLEQLEDEAIDHPLTPPIKEPEKQFAYAENNENVVSLVENSNFAAYHWPFKRVSVKAYAMLTQEEQDHIENSVLIIVNARGDPEKHETPEKMLPNRTNAAKTA